MYIQRLVYVCEHMCIEARRQPLSLTYNSAIQLDYPGVSQFFLPNSGIKSIHYYILACVCPGWVRF